MIEGLILAITLAVAIYDILTVIAIIILTIAEVFSWFRSKSALVTSDKNNVPFTLMDKLSSGDYGVIQGVFNKDTEKVLDARKYKAEQLDEQLKQAHRANPLVIYD